MQKRNHGIYLKRIYKEIYLALLVMADLTLNYKSLDVYIRELNFLECFHEKIHVIPEAKHNLYIFYNGEKKSQYILY